MRAIHRQGEEMFGLSQADTYAAGLVSALNVIAAFPHSARLRTETPTAVRVQPYRSHVIIYVVADTEIQVLRVRHSLEDWVSDPFADSQDGDPS